MDVRALHGVNLTGWLTLESWVTPGPFANSGALDEASLMAALGPVRYRDLVEEHRASFMGPSDFIMIAARGFNAVRLPVPWYVLGDDGPAHGSFVGCVECVDQAFDWAEEIGLRIVLSLSVSPGRHDLERSLGGDGLPGSWGALLEVIRALSSRYAHRVGFFGMEVLDLPLVRRRRGLGVTGGVPLHALRSYYQDAYDIVRGSAGDDVVVILPAAAQTIAWRPFASRGRYANVWLSCQLLHNADHTSASGPSGIRRLAAASRATLEELSRNALPVAVCSWSGALPYADALTTPEGRIALERVYLAEQLAIFRACPAWFFQTWKTAGRLPGWDARVSLATFERRMLA